MRKTEIKIVAFIDILGFSKIIEDYDKGEIPNILDELVDAIDPATYLVKGQHPVPENPYLYNWKECVTVKLFSDCLCVAAPLEYKSHGFVEQVKMFYRYLAGYQIVLLEKGFFVRGGIEIGSFYCDDNIIFSGGLVDAYKLESKEAKYSRILLGEKLLTLIKKDKFSSDDLSLMFEVSNDGLTFLNPFNSSTLDSALMDKLSEQMLKSIGVSGMLNESFVELENRNKRDTLIRIQKFVNEKLVSEKDEKISLKHKWFSDFINYQLQEKLKYGFSFTPFAIT